MPTISLPARCDRAAAQALLPQMIAVQTVEVQGNLRIDARACTRIGQAMLQLLLSARRAGAVIDGSPHLHATASQLGLTTPLFGDIARA
ncbi:chemotaxis protein CheX [Novosphingobium sp.]|uniref:chemotaxis protein CheX n=1 Tax=Novosphingobium sp. TaxID=1874826 RepID=UPI003B52142B